MAPSRWSLESVTLVDIEVVRFLNTCEESGIDLFHCSPYSTRVDAPREKKGKDKCEFQNPKFAYATK